MQYCIVSNDIALIMHYRALLKRSGLYTCIKFLTMSKAYYYLQIWNNLTMRYFSRAFFFNDWIIQFAIGLHLAPLGDLFFTKFFSIGSQHNKHHQMQWGDRHHLPRRLHAIPLTLLTRDKLFYPFRFRLKEQTSKWCTVLFTVIWNQNEMQNCMQFEFS